MSFKNEYTLNVDIKKRMSNLVPVVRQGDTVMLNFKVYDDGILFDLTDYTQSEIVFRLPSGETIIGQGELTDGVISYRFVGVELAEAGTVSVLLSIYSDMSVVSVRPFKIHVYDSLRDEELTNITILQDLITEVLSSQQELERIVSEVIHTRDYIESIYDDLEQSESTRNANELERVNNEDERIFNENERIQDEGIREENESNRIINSNLAIERLNAAMDNLDFKGTYSASINYVKHNVVQYNGESFVALKNVRGIIPTDDGENWRLVAKKGVDGAGASVNVIDNLNSTSITSTLSANQGRVLNEKIDSLEIELNQRIELTNTKVLTQNGEIIAHRGLNSIANEQTTMSYIKAYEHGIKSWECDVQNTSDSELVLVHDETLYRTTGDSRIVTQVSYSQISNLNTSRLVPHYSPSYIMTFDEFLKLAKNYPDVYVYPEIAAYQTPSCKIKTVEAVINNGMENRTTLQSFNFNDFNIVRQRSLKIKIGYLTPNLAKFNEALNLASNDPNAEILSDYNVVLNNPSLVTQCTQRGVGLAVWTVNDINVLKSLRAIGVNRFMTDSIVGGYI